MKTKHTPEQVFLLDGARFKLSFNDVQCEECGAENDRVTVDPLGMYANDLQGRWVALVPAENDKHLYLLHIKKQRDELLAAKGKVSVTLTGKEIREIAELAGLQFVEHDYTDEYETEIAIESCPDKGILNDDNAPEHYRLIAFLNEYPEEGCIGLGEKIEAAAIASVKGGA